MTFTLLSKLTQATLQSLYRNHRHSLKKVWALSVNLALLTLTCMSEPLVHTKLGMEMVRLL